MAPQFYILQVRSNRNILLFGSVIWKYTRKTFPKFYTSVTSFIITAVSKKVMIWLRLLNVYNGLCFSMYHLGTFFFMWFVGNNLQSHIQETLPSLFFAPVLIHLLSFFHSKNLSLSLIPIFEFYIYFFSLLNFTIFFFSFPNPSSTYHRNLCFLMSKSELVCSHRQT